MSKDIYLRSTRFALAPGVSADEVQTVIRKHMDGYAGRLELTVDVPDFNSNVERYVLDMPTAEVGHSFAERARDMVKGLGPLVANPFSVLVREDVMSDDRDQVIYGGPNQAAIDEFEGREQIEAAIECLGQSELAVLARTALRHILVGHARASREMPLSAMTLHEQHEKCRRDALQAMATKDWGPGKAFEKEADARASYEMATQWLAEAGMQPENVVAVTVSGGVVQDIAASLPGVKVVVVDYDNGSHLGEPGVRIVVCADNGPELASVDDGMVRLDPAWVGEVVRAIPQRLYAFAGDSADWFALQGQPTFDPAWMAMDGVILDVTDPKNPELAISAMHLHAQEMGEEMCARLHGFLEQMDLAVAKGEDASPGFEQSHAALAKLLDAAPWTHDHDKGGLTRRDADGSLGRAGATPREAAR